MVEVTECNYLSEGTGLVLLVKFIGGFLRLLVRLLDYNQDVSKSG